MKSVIIWVIVASWPQGHSDTGYASISQPTSYGVYASRKLCEENVNFREVTERYRNHDKNRLDKKSTVTCEPVWLIGKPQWFNKP